MSGEVRDLCALIAELAFVLAGFSIVAMALRTGQEEVPAAARLRAHALLFASLSPGLLALLMLGLSASGVGAELNCQIVSAVWVLASTAFLVFSMRFRRSFISAEDSMIPDIGSVVFMILVLPVTGLLVANAFVYGLFWPLFLAFFYQLVAATNAFYRLMFLGAR